MHIKRLYDTITQIAGKNQAGSFTPDKVMNLLHMAQTEMFNKYADRFPADKQSVNLLQPFMKTVTAHKNADKIFPFEDGVLDGVTTFEGQPIDWKPAFAYNHAKKSRVAPPTEKHPIYTIRDKRGIEVAPDTIQTIKLYYLLQPEPPEYVYSIQGTRYVFDEVNSKDVLWKEPAHPALIMRTLEKLGIKVREEELVQYSKIQEQHEIETK